MTASLRSPWTGCARQGSSCTIWPPRWRWRTGRLLAEPVRVGFPQGRLEGRIEAADLTQEPLAATVDMKADGVDLAPLAALAGLDQKVAGRLTGTLTGTVEGTAPETILAESELAFQGTLAGPAYGPYAAREVGFTAQLADGKAVLDPIRLVLPQGELGGRVATRQLGGGQAPEATVDLEAKQLDLTPFLVPTIVPKDRNLAGRFTGTLQGTIRGATPEALLKQSELTLEGGFEGLRYTDLVAREARLGAKLTGGQLTLDPVRLVLPEGGVTGRVATGPLDKPLTSEIDLTGTGVDLASILGAESGVGGVLSGKLKGVVRGQEAAQLLAQSQLGFTGTIERPKVPRLQGEMGTLNLTANLQPKGEQPLLVTAQGTLGGAPLRIELRGHDLPVLLAGKGAVPVALDVTLGQSRAGASGTVTLPLEAGRLDLALKVEGPNPGPILALLEMPAIELPPYSLAGKLARRGQTFSFSDIAGKVGDSDLGGTLQLRLDGARPKVTGDLRSALLDIDDLGGLIGSQPATGPGETASQGQKAEAKQEERDREVLPDKPLDPARWQQLDADVKLRAGEVRAGRIPLDAFELHTVLDAGKLRVEPLVLRLGEGRVEGWAQLDARKAPGAATLDLDLQRLPVGRLLNRLEVDTRSFGTLSGRARGGMSVGGEGLSVKQILSNGDGQNLAADGGRHAQPAAGDRARLRPPAPLRLDPGCRPAGGSDDLCAGGPHPQERHPGDPLAGDRHRRGGDRRPGYHRPRQRADRPRPLRQPQGGRRPGRAHRHQHRRHSGRPPYPGQPRPPPRPRCRRRHLRPPARAADRPRQPAGHRRPDPRTLLRHAGAGTGRRRPASGPDRGPLGCVPAPPRRVLAIR